MIRMRHEHSTDVEVARSLAKAHPDDWRAWWLVAGLAARDEAGAAQERMCALIAIDPVVLHDNPCLGPRLRRNREP